MIKIVKYNDYLDLKEFIKEYSFKSKINEDEILNLDFVKCENIEDEILQLNIFSNIKLIKIDNANFLNKIDEFKKNSKLINILINNEDLNFILCTKDKISVGAEIKEFLNTYKLIECKVLTENGKVKFIEEQLKKNDIKLSYENFQFLIKNLPCSKSIINNEIDKIVLLNHFDSNEEDIKFLIGQYNDESIFELLESILFKKYNIIWTIYNDLIEKKQDEIMIMNAISSQITNIYFCIKMSKDGYDNFKISKLLNVNPYFITIYKNKFINYNIKELELMIINLFNLEIKIKQSSLNKVIGLKNFIIQLSGKEL